MGNQKLTSVQDIKNDDLVDIEEKNHDREGGNIIYISHDPTFINAEEFYKILNSMSDGPKTPFQISKNIDISYPSCLRIIKKLCRKDMIKRAKRSITDDGKIIWNYEIAGDHE